MRVIDAALSDIESYRNLKRAYEKSDGPIWVSGVTDAAKAAVINSLRDSAKYRLVITHSELRMRSLCEELRFFDRSAVCWPSKDVIFFQADIHSNEIEAERLSVLKRLMDKRPVTVVATAASLLIPVVPLDDIRASVLSIDKRQPLAQELVVPRLVSMGYVRTPLVEAPGQFAVRGDILDVYDLTQEAPYRIEFWGDDITSIRSFDIMSQRSSEKLESIRIYPASAIVMDKDRMLGGMGRIRSELAGACESLRASFLTEEAVRLRTDTEDFLEALAQTPGSVNSDPYIKYFYEDADHLTDYFPPEESALFLDEPARISGQAEEIFNEFINSMKSRMEAGLCLPGVCSLASPPGEALAVLDKRKALELSALDANEDLIEGLKPIESFALNTAQIAPYNNAFPRLAEEVKKMSLKKEKVVIISGVRSRAKRLVEELREFGVTSFYNEDPMRTLEPGEVMLYYGQLSKGFALPDAGFFLISESDIFTQERRRKKRRSGSFRGEKIGNFAELKPGDYVVHEDHGLGIYRGIEKLETDNAVRDYIKVEYGDGGILYVLATGVDVLQKYAAGSEGGEARKIKLNRLGGTEWQHTKSKVRSAVDEIASDLVELYAKRQDERGFVFGEDTVWQQEFEDAFPFEETADQLDAIAAVKGDMQSDRIMDRLICGDVGFGKTEIAIRAAFKAVQDGKQVAVLVPTTILAQQHYNTFVRRMKDYPVKVELLSRFRTTGEQRRTVENLKNGTVDIVIGTHRLLSKDVCYSDLGLLVVDEEQRFGVTHKEKIKKLKESVDVLTLSATPIPRTLHMSLVGIRDMSLLEEAPNDRVPIQTFVTEYHEEIVREAITRELSRKGQVYYVYNRVNRIGEIAAGIASLVPEAKVAYAHGQMPEHELEKIMYDFIDGEIDVLVSTTIIETGLDIPNVNTMIIHDADKMGLAQLYQLRGRVGRSSRTAYAFLLYQRDKLLKEVAEKRLLAIREFTDLGSGYKIAMRDLEIRGAGNLLGKSQSGHIQEIGYDLYCKLLSQAVSQKKSGDRNELSQTDFTTTVDLTTDAFIPEDYIGALEQRLEVYKRIASVESDAEREDMRDELTDRFGEPPVCVDNLLRISVLRAMSHRLYILKLTGRHGMVKVKLFKNARLNSAGVESLVAAYKGQLKFYGAGTPELELKYRAGGDRLKSEGELLAVVEKFVYDMNKYLM